MKIKLLWLAIIMAFSFNHAIAEGDFHLFAIDNKAGTYTPEVIEKALAVNGYAISANSEMNRPFTIQFQKTRFKHFTLLTVFHQEFSQTLIKRHPEAGIFVPMGVGIYQANDEDTFHVSILTAKTQAKILGFDDEMLHSIEKATIDILKKALPGATLSNSGEAMEPNGPLVTLFEAEVDPDDWEDTKDELQMTIENGFKPRGFVMSNFTDFNFLLTKKNTVESPFDFYDTYSICKLKVIYNVSHKRPEASAFAPCTVMFYKKKGSDKIVIGFPGVYNWMSSASISDKETVDVLMKAQSDFEKILTEATE